MIHQISRFLLTGAFCLVTFFQVVAGSDFVQKKDSILQSIPSLDDEAKLKAYEKLLGLLDITTVTDDIVREHLQISDAARAEAAKQGNVKEQGRSMINTIVFLANNKRWKELDERKDLWLKFMWDHQLLDYYYGIKTTFLESYYLKTGKMEQAISEAEELYKEAKAENHPQGILASRLVIARALNSQRRYEEAQTYFEEGLKAYEDQKVSTPYLDGWWSYCALLIDTKQWEKALANIERFDTILHGFLKERNTSYPYLEAVILRLYAHAYRGIDQLDKAESYLDKADLLSGDLIGLSNSYGIRAEIENQRGNYDKALEYVAQVRTLRQSKRDYLDVMLSQFEATVWSGIEKAENTLKFSEQAFALSDSLSQKEFNEQLDALRTEYELDKLKAEKEINRQRWIIATSVSLLLLLLLIVYAVYSRRLKRKNEQLFLRIQELLQKEKKSEEYLLSRPEESLSKELRLFRRVSELMQAEKLFTDSGITRKKLSDLLGTNETYLADAIREGTGETFSGYLSTLRLQYSLFLIEKNHDMTFDGIALDSGFASYSPYYRSFVKKYGITPSEYKRLAATRANE